VLKEKRENILDSFLNAILALRQVVSIIYNFLPGRGDRLIRIMRKLFHWIFGAGIMLIFVGLFYLVVDRSSLCL
jgi:hypothetical protein